MASELTIGKLFEKVHSKELGNYLIAKEDFEEGQLICTEPPLISFPKEAMERHEANVCIGCYKHLPYITLFCRKCQWPICSRACENDPVHMELECPLFASRNILPTRRKYGHLKYLRVVLLKTIYPDKYDKVISMVSEFDESTRQTLSEIMTLDSKRSLKFLKEECALTVALEEVEKIWAILKVNSFLVQTGHRGTTVYEHSCKLAHGCHFNCQWSHEKIVKYNGSSVWCMNLHARLKIKKGETLTIAYSPRGLDYDTGFRKEFYQIGFPFSCICSRCTDESEGRTYFSSPKCTNCKGGYLVPKVPLKSLSCEWKCKSCVHTEDGDAVQKKISKINNYVNRLCDKKGSDYRLDEFIEKYSRRILHPNHFLIFKATTKWLIEFEFINYLIDDDESFDKDKLYLEIRERAGRCIRLARRFMPIHIIAEFEICVAQVIAAYTFKCPDGISIKHQHEDPRLNFRFAKNILHHFRESRKWVDMQPRANKFEERKLKMAKRCSIWERNYQKYSRKLEEYEEPFEEAGLLGIRNLFTLDNDGNLGQLQFLLCPPSIIVYFDQ